MIIPRDINLKRCGKLGSGSNYPINWNLTPITVYSERLAIT